MKRGGVLPTAPRTNDSIPLGVFPRVLVRVTNWPFAVKMYTEVYILHRNQWSIIYHIVFFYLRVPSPTIFGGVHRGTTNCTSTKNKKEGTRMRSR